MTSSSGIKKVVVSKFGGTSMGSASAMLQSARVAYQQKSSLVVVSATSGTTNALIDLSQKARLTNWSDAETLINSIKDRHLAISKALSPSAWTQNSLNTLLLEVESIARGIFLLKECSPRALDALVSLGERMSSILFSEALKTVFQNSKDRNIEVKWLDVRDVLITDDNFGRARPNTKEIQHRCESLSSELHSSSTVFVTQGYIGKTQENLTTTLGRGGSDYSAAILAEALHAQVLEIWTDVAGIATTDPRICAGAKWIPEISFTEASELASFGAKVLHPATLLPAIRQNIPVFVGSTFEPEKKGTWVKQTVQDQPLVRAFAIKKKQILVTLSTPEMLHAHGFLFQIFKIFNDHQVSIDSITTSEISVALTLDDSTLLNKKLLQELSAIAEVHVEENLCLVSLIGNNINHTAGLAKKIFDTIPDINVRMICLGASKHNFCFVVAESAGESVIQRLHQHFI